MKEKPVPIHDEVKAKLVEIGRLQKLIAETEYPLDGTKLDAVWRRVEKAVPAYVFEVQIGGDIYHALGKLKHALSVFVSKKKLADASRSFSFFLEPSDNFDLTNNLLFDGD